MRTCTRPDCARRHVARGLCNAHYLLARDHGELSPLVRPSEQDRFWSNVVRGPDCWAWTGGHSVAGYGRFNRDGRRPDYAHRYSYELHKGVIPAGCQIDHLCHNRGCCNPAHLEAVTQQENIRRGEVGTQTHCPHGHPYDEVNTRRNSRGYRFCRECNRQASRKYKQRVRAAMEAV